MLKLAYLRVRRWTRDTWRSLPTWLNLLICTTALGELLFFEAQGLSQVKDLKRQSPSYSGLRLYIICKLDIPVLLLTELKVNNADVKWRFNFSLEWGQVLLVPLRNFVFGEVYNFIKLKGHSGPRQWRKAKNYFACVPSGTKWMKLVRISSCMTSIPCSFLQLWLSFFCIWAFIESAPVKLFPSSL